MDNVAIKRWLMGLSPFSRDDHFPEKGSMDDHSPTDLLNCSVRNVVLTGVERGVGFEPRWPQRREGESIIFKGGANNINKPCTYSPPIVKHIADENSKGTVIYIGSIFRDHLPEKELSREGTGVEQVGFVPRLPQRPGGEGIIFKGGANNINKPCPRQLLST